MAADEVSRTLQTKPNDFMQPSQNGSAAARGASQRFREALDWTGML